MRRLLAILFMLSAFVSTGQQIQTFLSNEQLLIGQPDTLTIKISTSTQNILLPQFTDTLSVDLEVLGVSKVDSSTNGLGFEFVQQVYFTSFDTGDFVVPPISFDVEDSTLYSQYSSVTVTSVVIDLAKNIHGIQDIEDAPITLKEVLETVGKVIFSLLVILLIIWVVKKYYLKYKLSKENEQKVVPEIPFMDTFWEKLSSIEEQKFWQKGEVKKFHSQVTALMRTYLEYRYGVSAMEQTTDEILVQLQILVSDKSLYNKIEQTLKFADMVKFAKATGVQGQHEKAIDNLKELVEITNLNSTDSSE